MLEDIEKITEKDLQTLIDNKVLEQKTIEYKRALPTNSDKDKKEFLADVSSFANASGGDLIYGMTEDKKTGYPKSLDGLDIENDDKEILRLDNIIRDGVKPRIPSTSIRVIPLKNAKKTLIIRANKSWMSPHRVTYGGHDKFYTRSSNGKYPLDVGELRIAFNLSETITERIRNFRLDRISKIFANETPVPLYDNPKIVLHLIPITSFNPSQSYDIIKVASDTTYMSPIRSSGWNHRYNLDGVIAYSEGQDGKSRSYVQFFRNGILEAVNGYLIPLREVRPLIPSVAYEEALIKSLTDYLSLSKSLNIELPIFIFLDLLKVKGYSMGINTWRYNIDEIHTIDRDILLLPEIIVENYDDEVAKVLKPCFDAIWNACGFQGSFNYNDADEWSPK